MRGHKNQTTAKHVVTNRSPSPPLIFRHQTQNDIRIITDVQPPSQSSAAASTNRSHVSNYENQFDTMFRCGEIKFHSQRLGNPFSLPESWLSEHLINYNYQPDEYHENTTNGKRCSCCLCTVRHRCGNTGICIEKHPTDEPCAKDQEMLPKNTMLKYQKRHICDTCMSSLTLNTKKTKQKYFQCCFQSCSIQIKSITSLRTHYLEHLAVKNFICSVCEKNYKSRAGLKKHEREKH